MNGLKGALRTILAGLHQTLFRYRFAARAKHWQPTRPTRLPTSPRLVLSGFFNEALGIGIAGVMTRDRLQSEEFSILMDDLRPYEAKLLQRPPFAFDQACDATVWLIHANPPEAMIALYTHDHQAWQDLYRIGYWVWETDIPPRDWLEMARWFHEIWVPSKFSYESFKQAFVAVGMVSTADKLRIVPHPVSIPNPSRKTAKASVTALTLFDPRSDFDRKNPLGAIAAWVRAFPRASGLARLIVKTHAAARDHPRYRALQRQISNRPDITLMAETLSSEDVLALIGDSDILLSMHRAEGFGLPLAEAMARGVCVVATGWSGNLQFMTEDNSVLIPYTLVPATKAYNGPHAQWAEPDIATAATALRQLVNDPAHRAKLGERARRDMRAAYDAWTCGIN